MLLHLKTYHGEAIMSHDAEDWLSGACSSLEKAIDDSNAH
jgi:hypothetical protein